MAIILPLLLQGTENNENLITIINRDTVEAKYDRFVTVIPELVRPSIGGT